MTRRLDRLNEAHDAWEGSGPTPRGGAGRPSAAVSAPQDLFGGPVEHVERVSRARSDEDTGARTFAPAPAPAPAPAAGVAPVVIPPTAGATPVAEDPPEVGARGHGVDAEVELLERMIGEQSTLARLADSDPRLVLLAAGWLAGFRSPRTRRAYAGDLVAFTGWCRLRGLAVLGARRVQVDLHVTGLLDAGAAASSVARRLSALSSFYRFCLAQDELSMSGLGVERDPTIGVRRPGIDHDHTTTAGLSADEARALIASADADLGPQRLRTAALVRLLLHTALRVDEALGADIADLGTAPGRERAHRTLAVVRKGGRGAVVVLAPEVTAALEASLDRRGALAGVPRGELVGPLLATRAGKRLCQKDVWVLVRRLARAAGIASWEKLSPHSLRHTSITAALDGGASLRDAQDFAGHRDPRTTRRYDLARGALDRNPTYLVASLLSSR